MPKANTIYSKNSTLQQPQQILYNANLCCTIPSDTIFQRCHPCSITWLKNRNCFIAFTFILAVLGEQANLEKITKCMLFPHKPVNTKKTKKNLLSLRPKPQGNPPKPLLCVPESSTMFLSWKPAVQHSTKLTFAQFCMCKSSAFYWQLFFTVLISCIQIKSTIN